MSEIACLNRAYGEEMLSDFAYCDLWRRGRWSRWPCTSPRRNHCRRGMCQHDGYLKGAWDWFQLEYRPLGFTGSCNARCAEAP